MTTSEPPTSAPAAVSRRRIAAWLTGVALLALGLVWVGERWAQSTASAVTRADAQQLASSNALLFDSELQRFRLLPVALAEYPDVAALLSGGATIEAVNNRLERLAAKTGASAIYVIRPDGLTVASSNHRLPTSFVGQNYAFRPYFRDALRGGDAELFAVGTVSGRAGLYLSRRIGEADRPLGVIVVKIEFDALQRAWARQPGATLVADANDIVIISGRAEWRYRTLRDLDSNTRSRIAQDRLFEGVALRPLPFEVGRGDVRLNGAPFSQDSAPVALSGGRLVALAPMARAIDSARAQAWTVIVSVIFGLLGLLAWQFRQMERAASQRAEQRELELKVAERTAELEAANRQLVVESTERMNSEARYRRSREELAQANRLGTLGQVTAGVAHEINQPVAAIRTFAENAAKFLEQGKADKAGTNLGHIVGLTERIAAITSELRGFARRKTPAIAATSLAEAIDASLLLVRHRIAGANAAVKWSRRAAAISVRADRIRLEQIFVNLIQNSLDALEGRADAIIEMSVREEGDQVVILVTDNGPGLPEHIRPRVFMPFSTGKHDGLGLGLAIVRDIVREFGGEIRLVEGEGARFELRLARA